MQFTPHMAREPLETRIEKSKTVSAGLFAEICSSSERLTHLAQMGKTSRLERLLESEAWTEAALELAALAAPEWSVRRLCRIDGQWLCSLTRFPDMPDWLDEAAEATHSLMPMAILGAIAEIRARTPDVQRASHSAPMPALAADVADYR